MKLTFGADLVSERHMVETFDQKLIAPVVQADGTVLHAAGTIIPGQNHGVRRALENVAAFAQSLLTLTDDWSDRKTRSPSAPSWTDPGRSPRRGRNSPRKFS